MKHTIFILLILMSVFSANGQKITFDIIEKDGTRHLGTESLALKIENGTYDFSLTAFSNPNSKVYALLISSIWMMKEDCIVMLKLGNEEIVKLTSNNINVGKIDYPSYTPIIGNTSNSGIMSTQKVDYYVSLYTLEKELLNKINQNGIIKLRISFGDTFFERSWKKDELGKHITSSYKKLEEHLQNPHISNKSIEDDF